MKTIKYLSIRLLAITAIAVGFTLQGKAQTLGNYYANVDWQFNFPNSDGFAKKGSGWGMNLEGGYYLTDNLSIGAFLTYHSNHKYIPRQTIVLPESGSLNTDQQHTLFQLPFGVSGRYTMNREGMFQPYFGLKIGPQYGQLKTVFNVFQETNNTWGFYMSPEIGVNIFPWVYRPGIHVAAYYSYATNKGSLMTYHVDGMSNFGLRLGISF